ncbi:MAG: M48 family metalloprotease [Chlamydiae bacterium]|nr:M48 family metalloprotease [Chlamydiota bacterium]
MATPIDQSTTSYLQETMFYIREIIKDAAIQSIPIIPSTVCAAASWAKTFIPTIFMTNEKEKDQEDFCLNTKEEKERVIEIFCQRRLKFIGFNEEEIENIKTKIREKFLEKLEIWITEASKSAEKLGIKNLEFYIEIPEEVETVYVLMQTNGNLFFSLSPPNISLTLQTNFEFQKTSDKWEEKGFPYLEQKFLNEVFIRGLALDDAAINFLFVHELLHLKARHTIIRAIFCTIIAISNIFLWVKGMKAAGSWKDNLMQTYPKSFLFHLFSTCLQTWVFYKQEKEADIGAMETLGSNEGAIQFFTPFVTYKMQNQSIVHPSHQERLRYCSLWKKKTGLNSQ